MPKFNLVFDYSVEGQASLSVEAATEQDALMKFAKDYNMPPIQEEADDFHVVDLTQHANDSLWDAIDMRNQLNNYDTCTFSPSHIEENE